MNNWKEKLASRKFWICVAAFLGSIAASISGIATSNQTITTIGIVCGVLSAAIYAFCEAWVDGKAVTKSIEIIKPNEVKNDGNNETADN